jgi:hypothetical protein
VLDAVGTKSEQSGMDNRDCLAHYPFVVVRIGCRVCNRRRTYRLARLAAKFGTEISLRDLTDRFSYDCMWRAEARSKKGKSACCGSSRKSDCWRLAEGVSRAMGLSRRPSQLGRRDACSVQQRMPTSGPDSIG